jgi:hypothetical protein
MSETFRMTPANGGPLGFMGIADLIIFGLLILFFYIGYSARNTNFIVSPEGLRIKGTLYGRFIPRDQIQLPLVKPLDLNNLTEYRPSWRTNGIGLPGYGAGWFKLKNGEKALLFLTDKSRVVYIPTTKEYSLLVSVSDPVKFVESLKSHITP